MRLDRILAILLGASLLIGFVHPAIRQHVLLGIQVAMGRIQAQGRDGLSILRYKKPHFNEGNGVRSSDIAIARTADYDFDPDGFKSRIETLGKESDLDPTNLLAATVYVRTAYRSTSHPGKSFDPAGNTKTIENVIRISRRSGVLEPENWFWRMIEVGHLALLGRKAESRARLLAKPTPTQYNERLFAQATTARRTYRQSLPAFTVYMETTLEAGITLPHLTMYRHRFCEVAFFNANDFEARTAVCLAATAMARDSETVIGFVIAKSLVSTMESGEIKTYTRPPVKTIPDPLLAKVGSFLAPNDKRQLDVVRKSDPGKFTFPELDLSGLVPLITVGPFWLSLALFSLVSILQGLYGKKPSISGWYLVIPIALLFVWTPQEFFLGLLKLDNGYPAYKLDPQFYGSVGFLTGLITSVLCVFVVNYRKEKGVIWIGTGLGVLLVCSALWNWLIIIIVLMAVIAITSPVRGPSGHIGLALCLAVFSLLCLSPILKEGGWNFGTLIPAVLFVVLSIFCYKIPEDPTKPRYTILVTPLLLLWVGATLGIAKDRSLPDWLSQDEVILRELKSGFN